MQVWIWNLGEQHFPGAVRILDLYHARQHLWELARRLHPNDESRTQPIPRRQSPRMLSLISKIRAGSYAPRYSIGLTPQPNAPQAKQPPRVSVVVVSRNRAALLQRCLGSLEQSDARPTLQVIVVDNGSSDGSAQLESAFPAAQFIPLPKNFGLTKALNIGWRAADAPYLFFLLPPRRPRGRAPPRRPPRRCARRQSRDRRRLPPTGGCRRPARPATRPLPARWQLASRS